MIADAPMSWRVRRQEVLGRGAVSSFVDDEVETPSGQVVRRQYLTHPGAVAVVAWDEAADEIVCLHQYRHPVRTEFVEIPAGLLDGDGEDFLAAAERELAEEAELAADRWQVLVDMCTSPGSNEESLRIYLARDLRAAPRTDGFELEGEEAEMSVERIARADLVDAVLAGQVQSPTLVAGILALQTAILSDRLGSLRASDAPWPIRDRRQ